jgi:uncharacterized protein YndB with AHSA1/START domain
MLKVEKSIVVAAKPDRVWRAWTGEIAKWWTKPYFIDAERATGLTLEPQVGGRFMETWGDGGAGYLLGQVVEWLPPHRLAFTWSESDWAGASTVVKVKFEPDGQGTRVTLTHEGFERVPDGEGQRSGYTAGWGDLLDKLKAYTDER